MKKLAKVFMSLIFAAICMTGLVSCKDSDKSNGDKSSSVANASVWNGNIPGWKAPKQTKEEIIKNRPKTYVVDNDDNPKIIEINDANAFAWFAYRSVIGENGYSGVTVKLNCDINLNNHMWLPIGLGGRSNAPRVPFMGTFDGQGHTIYNFSSKQFMEKIKYGQFKNYLTEKPELGYYIEYENESTTGLIKVCIPIEVKTNSDTDQFDEVTFGLFATTKNATIKNLKLDGVTIDVKTKYFDDGRKLIGDSVGALVGFARGNITLENCKVGKKDNGPSTSFIKGGTCEAGLIGRAYAGSDNTNISSRVGELGKNQPFGEINIKNCTNNLEITASKEKGDKTAGIVGYVKYFKTLNIENCINNGIISGNSYTAGIVAYQDGIELIPEYGYNNDALKSNVRITSCINNGKTADNTFKNSDGTFVGYVGGIIGLRKVPNISSDSSYEISNCVNHAEIVLNCTGKDGNLSIGGLVGDIQASGGLGNLKNNSNDGKVTVEAKDVSKVYAGGIMGRLDITGLKSAKGSLAVSTCSNGGNIVAAGHDNVVCDEYNQFNKCIGILEKQSGDEDKLVFETVSGIPSFTNTGKFVTQA